MDDRTFYAKIKADTRRFFYKQVRVYPPIQPTGQESRWRDVLKTSRMRYGKKRTDLDAAILKQLQSNF
jgi:hypothetical protein